MSEDKNTQSDYASSWQLSLSVQTTGHVEDRVDSINAFINLTSPAFETLHLKGTLSYVGWFTLLS